MQGEGVVARHVRGVFALTVTVLMLSVAAGAFGQNPSSAKDVPTSQTVVQTNWSVFNLTLGAGWNFVSLPLTGYGYTAGTLGLNHGDAVFRVNPGPGILYSAYYVGISPPPMDFPIEPSCGYFIWTNVAKTLTIYGEVPTMLQQRNITVPAGGGWAAIGFVGFTHRHASNVPALYSGGLISTVVRVYKPDYIIMWQTYIVGVPMTDFALVPGSAYWIYVTGSGTLSYMP